MKIRSLLGLAALSLAPALLTGCSESAAASSEEAYPLTENPYPITNKEKYQLTPSGQAAIARILEYCFGKPEEPFLPGLEAGKNQNPTVDAAKATEAGMEAVGQGTAGARSPARSGENPVVLGRKLFRQHCVHCHGYYGGGDGPTAPFLLPKPRDFRRGQFKFMSTNAGSYNRPTHEDLTRTIAQGIPGTMMPAFGPIEGIPELGLVAGFAGPQGFDVSAVAYYVQVLAMRGELEKKLVTILKNNQNDLFFDQKDKDVEPDDKAVAQAISGVMKAWDPKTTAGQVVKPSVPRPARTEQAIAESVKKGMNFFQLKDAQCVKCHGKLGKGDGVDQDEAKRDKDDWGEPIRPANLTLGVYRGGRRPIDLFRRVKSGVGGVMPGFGGTLSDEQVWNIVDYVQSLGLPQEKK